ncbi:hypothetical protein [Planctomyces sp. SH-PL14]|nr:hypothetical protein [Planctomyces sp. SH-PL14]
MSLENSQGRLTERGYRLAFAEPWYAGGGVAFFWCEQMVFEPRPV